MDTYGNKFQHMNNRSCLWYSKGTYSYGNTSHSATAMDDPILNDLITEISNTMSVNFNSVLINLYKNGSDFMPYHSDNEMSIKLDKIASLSIGATRLFSLLPKYNAHHSYHTYLTSGSLMTMRGNTQDYWSHSLIQQPYICEPRINLTFRNVG